MLAHGTSPQLLCLAKLLWYTFLNYSIRLWSIVCSNTIPNPNLLVYVLDFLNYLWLLHLHRILLAVLIYIIYLQVLLLVDHIFIYLFDFLYDWRLGNSTRFINFLSIGLLHRILILNIMINFLLYASLNLSNNILLLLVLKNWNCISHIWVVVTLTLRLCLFIHQCYFTFYAIFIYNQLLLFFNLIIV